MALQNCAYCQRQYKYKCPKCLLRTCSLECNLRHKQDQKCSGRVETGAEYIKISDMNATILDSDCKLLDQASRCLETTCRAFAESIKIEKRAQRWRGPNSELRKCCNKKNIRLVFAPGIFKRSRMNRAIVRKNTIYWTVEYVIGKYILYQKRMSDDTILQDAIFGQLDAIQKSKKYKALLSEYINQRETLVVLISSNIRHCDFYACNMGMSIAENLRDATVYNYPRFYLVLPKDALKYNQVSRIPMAAIPIALPILETSVSR
ncbi:zinc finger protein [Babesia duncani]|uniref:Zinc finger protein n=1 Tax=Babesia duncani TaxID=323732 RepID=A0AAD9UMW4_9APIC|nr:zinc finger protein [Babesia duncani]